MTDSSLSLFVSRVFTNDPYYALPFYYLAFGTYSSYRRTNLHEFNTILNMKFTPLESPAVYGWVGIDKILIFLIERAGVYPSFLTGFT